MKSFPPRAGALQSFPGLLDNPSMLLLRSGCIQNVAGLDNSFLLLASHQTQAIGRLFLFHLPISKCDCSPGTRQLQHL